MKSLKYQDIAYYPKYRQMNKYYLLFIIFILNSQIAFSQGYDNDKITLTNFIKRMYNSEPFTGVKVIEDYENNYLISVVMLDKTKYKTTSTMDRVAQVKAQSQLSTFLNGSNIEMDFVVTTTEKRSDKAIEITVETIESIKENSVGVVNGIELLSNFEAQKEQGHIVYIYIKEIEDF